MNTPTVVVMRPVEQSGALIAALTALGVTPVALPMLSIHSVVLSPDHLQEAISAIAEAHYVIVTSANVIRHCPPALIKALDRAMIITLGKSTTASLTSYGLSAIYTPEIGTTSESLLEAPLLAAGHVRHKNILILTGKGGRTVLKDALTERGASVKTVICYEAMKPPHDLTTYFQQWRQQSDPICFLISSLKILQNLVSLTPPDAIAWLHRQVLVVVSSRIKRDAEQLGFQQILVSGSADTDELVRAVACWQEDQSFFKPF